MYEFMQNEKKRREKLAELLHEKHGMGEEEADYTTTNYLKAFRKCPDNPSMSLEQWRTDLWQKALPEQFRHLTYEVYEQWLKLRYHYLELPNELVQMLKQLRKNYLLAIITNGPSNAQWEKIHKLGLNMGKSSLFDCILVSADLAWEKPDPRIFLAACNYLGVTPNDCIMVGDKIETDIKGASEAGLMASVWLPLNYPDPVDVSQRTIYPDITISNIYELKSLLIVDDVTPTHATTQGPSTSGNSRSLKLKACRSTGVGNGASPSSSTLSSCTGTGCFSSSKGKVNASNTAPYPKRFLPPPDLDNNNSNASDGS
ncbi:CLUMA_CG003872, isoform B [Clunio marinus]|uniref:CLUMA_CG003872, isoform B n=1 Tax=Clunio marinus TaxID=568069 RepID=A0A1J1HUI0_9DIPT|nr:CLUMA_CG003872, isoform B [Clunio marinus]